MPLRRLFRWVTRPLARALALRIRVDDPWEPVSRVRFDALAPGSTRPFSWYREGKSTVSVASIADVCDWLCTCHYVSDRTLFQQPDFWQHPVTFEHLKRGDCEDYALWAWRKLLELGVDARFVVGSWRSKTDAEWGVHAWVEYTSDGEPFHLEPIRHDRDRMTQPLAAVRELYAPHYSVDKSFQPRVHAGLILYHRRVEIARRAARSAAKRS